MHELTLYRMWRFFENEFKRLELLKDLGAGINLSSENYSLLDLLDDKLNISFSEYINKRDYVISSKIRNLKLIKNIFCTKLASKISKTDSSSHGYKDLVKEICGKDISKK